MSIIGKIRDDIVYNLQEEIESYFVQRYPISGVECDADDFKVEEDLGSVFLNLWAIIELKNPIEELEINIDELTKDLSPQLKEYLAQDYALRQFAVEGWIVDNSEANITNQLEFSIKIELEFEEEPIEWDVEDWFPIPTKRVPVGYFVTKSEFSRLERIFLAYRGSEYVDEELDLLEAIGRIFDLIVGSALMDQEHDPGGLLFVLLDAYNNLKTGMK